MILMSTEEYQVVYCSIQSVTTSVGNVIVADCINDTLHVISGEGELLTYKVMLDPINIRCNINNYYITIYICDTEWVSK
jgi:hypothetical protein